MLNKKAFTIPELIIVMTIMALLMAVGIPSLTSQRRQLEFNQAASTILQLIKDARSYAMTSKPMENGIIPQEGYGIKIDSLTPTQTTLTLFANIGTNKNDFDEGDVIEKSYEIPDGIRVTGFKGDGSVISTESGEISITFIFKPPLAEVTMKDYNQFEMELKSGFLKTTTIQMNAISGFPEIKFQN